VTDYYGNTRWDVLDILPKKPYSRILEVGGGDFNTALRIKGSNDAAAWGVDLRQTASTLDHFVQGSSSRTTSLNISPTPKLFSRFSPKNWRPTAS
jgi:hypothetical protein